jgi:hypothetical protein
MTARDSGSSSDGWIRTAAATGAAALRRLALVSLLCLLAACAAGPQAPLLSPLDVAKRYGYTEATLGPAKIQVTYVGPSRQSSVYASEREPDANAARTQAYDLAVWRAAQIALERGFAGFHVDSSRADIETTYDDPFSDPFYGPFGPPYGPYFGSPFRRRLWGYPGFYPAYNPFAYIQARVTIDVTLLQALGPGDYVAQDAIAQLRRTYPTAEGIAANVAAPSPPPPAVSPPAPAAPAAPALPPSS